MNTSAWLEATVLTAALATPNGRLLTLDVPGWPGNAAGQHLDVRLTAEDGYQAVRSYSMASYGTSTRVELAVDRLPDGEVSPYLVDDVRPGDKVEVKGPIGGYFIWGPTQTEPVQLIAGGSGVVPLMAMVRAHADSGSAAEFRLLYSVRTYEYAYYADELNRHVARGLVLSWVYTSQGPPGWPHPVARISRRVIDECAITAERSPTVYVCGSNGFVELAASLLVTLGHDPMRIKTERYGG